jgi:hypothetical protein
MSVSGFFSVRVFNLIKNHLWGVNVVDEKKDLVEFEFFFPIKIWIRD